MFVPACQSALEEAKLFREALCTTRPMGQVAPSSSMVTAPAITSPSIEMSGCCVNDAVGLMRSPAASPRLFLPSPSCSSRGSRWPARLRRRRGARHARAPAGVLNPVFFYAFFEIDYKRPDSSISRVCDVNSLASRSIALASAITCAPSWSSKSTSVAILCRSVPGVKEATRFI